MKLYWHAFMRDKRDDDWGTGSFDEQEARDWMEAQHASGNTEAYIAIIDGDYDEDGNPTTDPIAVDVIE